MRIFPIAISAIILGLSANFTLAAGGHDHGHGYAAPDGQQGSPIANYRELTADEQIVQDVLDTYARAMEESSADIMERAVIPGDFSTIESGYPNWTWEDFRDNHLLVEMKAFSDVSYKNQLIVGELQGTLGFAVYQYTASGTAQGRTISISGLGTAILEDTEAGWRIHHLHTSAPRDQLANAAGDE